MPIPNRTAFHWRNFDQPDEISPVKKSWWNTLYLYGVYFICAALLNRFMLPGGVYPAGAAFFLVSINQIKRLSRSEMCAVFLGSLVGVFSMEGVENAVKFGTISLLTYVIIQLVNRKKGTGPQWNIALITWGILKLIITGIGSPSINTWITTGIELITGYLLILIFAQGFPVIANPTKTKSKYNLVALWLIMVLALGGTRELVIQSINIADISIALVIMMVSYIGGGGIGAAMGISIALITGIWSKNLIALVALYSLPGFLGGFFRDLGKMGTVIGSCLGLLLVSLERHFDFGMIWNTLPWGVGMATFLMVPRKCLAQISNSLSTQADHPIVSKEQGQIREIIFERLNNLAGIFTELAQNFNEELQEPAAGRKMDLYSMLDEVCTKNCQHCNGYEVCWGENFYATYREIFDLIAYAELYGEVHAKHVKGRLTKSCFQQFKLLATINQLFERCQTEFHWERKLNESKFVLVDQLQGVSNLISNLAQEINTDVTFKHEMEEKLHNGLHQVGISIKELSVFTTGNENLEIRVKQRDCNQRRECVYITGAMIGRLLGQEYSVWERNCHLENGDCSYCLVPSYNYEVKNTVCKVPKEGNQFSGDNHSLHKLKDGHFIAILSDGMGNGSKAAIESNTTVSILNKLLEIGIDRDFAVRMVNSILLWHSPAESFATVDLVQIDLYNGEAEFIKIGASATYIKRGKDVWAIKSTSLPAGILNSVDIERTTIQLQPDDLIIMATDGVVDSKQPVPGKEEWLIRALKQVEVVGPEALGEYLLSLAKINQDGNPQDDMTVIVLQIQEKKVC
jgi:stage II sporulation protein E